MKRFLLMALMTLGMVGLSFGKPNAMTPTAPVTVTCNDCSQYRQFAIAIAKQEGFFIRGSIPNRLHNPGDLKANGFRFPGQVGTDKHGHAIFRNDNAGWAALQNQVRKMCASEGKYSVTMTLQQVAKMYARDWRRWSKNVARNLNCDPKVTLAELFGIPPALFHPIDTKVIEDILPKVSPVPPLQQLMDLEQMWLLYLQDQLEPTRAQNFV